MAESFQTNENIIDEIENLRHYSVLNVPRTSDLAHIQRNFKQLSRVYHPDKSIADQQDVAQQSFIAVKTAADVLSDPIYRIAYDHGGEKAVMLVKRAQMARHSKKSTLPENVDSKTENDFDDLYSMLEHAVDDQEAAWIIHQVLEESQIQNQKGMSIAQWDLSCEVPLTWKEATTYSDAPLLEKDSVLLNAHARYPISSQVGVSLGAGSEYQHSAETNIKGSIGCDYQPIQGTSITTNIACNHRKAPELSVNSSRKFANGSVMVVAAHGSVTNTKSWNASFISSRPILLDSLYGRLSCPTLEPAKLMASWRIICSPAGTLRSISTSLRSLEHPIWSCRLAMSNYPIKVSWQGAETNSFYAAISLGMHFPRIKLLRISSFGDQWKLKYGLKHDVQAFFTKGSLWSIICSLQSNELSIRLPISLETTTPVAWIVSILFAEFIDQRLKQIQWSIRDKNERGMTALKNGTAVVGFFPLQSFALVRNVASKKREIEASKVDGLVILEAAMFVQEASHDVGDVLQFWVVDSKLDMSVEDPRLFGHVKRVHSNSIEIQQQNKWIDSLFGFCMPTMKDKKELMKTSLVVRYQHCGNTYQIAFEDGHEIHLPNVNAAELGPSNRVR